MSANDDYAPPPIAPGLEFVDQDETSEELIAQDQRLAKSYFHPAWEGIEQLFIDEIESLRIGCTNGSLPNDEYIVEDKALKKTAAKLTDILMRVQNAVRETEKRKGE